MSAWPKEVWAMVGLVFLTISAIVWFNIWDAGYLGSYWERWEGKGDIKCFDAQGHITTSSKGPCYVLTLRGIKARERLTEACKSKGKNTDECRELATNEMARYLSSMGGWRNP